VGRFDAVECLGDIAASMGMESSAMTLDEASNGVRKVLGLLHPQDLEHHWTEENCRELAASVFHDLGQTPASTPTEHGVFEHHVPPAAGPTPLLVRIAQMAMNATASTGMNMFGLRSVEVETPTAFLSYYDSGTPPMPASSVPIVLIHGFYTTGVSMGVMGAFLSRTRRVLILDLPDFDYGFSRLKASQPGQPRAGDYKAHVSAVVWLLTRIAGQTEGGLVDIAGHSYGGRVVAESSKQAAALVRHTILITPAFCGFHKVVGTLGRPPTQDLTKPTWFLQLVLWLLVAVFRSPNALNFWSGLAHGEHGLREWYSGEEWPMKTLLIFTDGDELVVPRPVHKIAELLPRGEGHWLEKAPHHLVIESAKSACDCIADFSARNGGDRREEDEEGFHLPWRYRLLHFALGGLTSKRVDIVFDHLGAGRGQRGASCSSDAVVVRSAM